jgi:uncharacterized protein YndB with AHSA1/START domain
MREGQLMATDLQTPHSDEVLVLTRLLQAPPSLVFQVWTMPEHLVQCFGPSDFTLPVCEVDFRVGGSYRFCMLSPTGSKHWAWGEYLEINEPHRLVFTWNRETGDVVDGSESLVTVTLEERGDKTLLTLTHVRLRAAKDRSDHRQGWSECLDRIAEYSAARAASIR